MSVERILNSVQSRLNGGVLEDFARAELLDVTENYFEKTCAWRESIDVTFRVGRRETTIPLPDTACRVIQIWYVGDNNQNLIPVPATVEGELNTRLVQFVPPFTLRLREGRDEEFDASFVCALTATDLDAFSDELMERHREGLTHALLARLYAIPQRPWTSDKMMVWHSRMERRFVSEATRQAARNYGGPLWMFPQFA